MSHEKNLSCYMCDSPATSMEHAPPRCFFPKESDLPPKIRKDVRKNLIKVPSCERHNCEKSSQDEYLRFLICATFRGNDFKEVHFQDKVLRSFKRASGKFSQFAKEFKPVSIQGPSGKTEESAIVRVDGKQFESAIENMGRAIHFHHFGEKAPQHCLVHTAEFLDVTSERRDIVNAAHKKIQGVVDNALGESERFGDNPEIFYYQVLHDPQGCPIFSFTFYEGMKVTVGFSEHPKLGTRKPRKGSRSTPSPKLRAAIRKSLGLE